MSDAELLRQYLQQGSEEAFQALVRRHVDLVYGTALRRTRNPQLAEEAAQNVFIALARKAPFLVERADLSGWLYKAALLKARERLREEARRNLRESVAANLGTTMKSDDASRQAMAAALDDALLDLREKDRQALLLRFFENKNLREVGAALGVSEDAAQKRVSSALELLTHAFRRRGYAVAGTAAVTSLFAEAGSSAPAAFAAIVARAALQKSAAASLTGLGWLATRILIMTKTQTLWLCVIVGAMPIASQWHATNSERARQRELSNQLAASERDLATMSDDEKRLQRRLDSARDRNSRLEDSITRRRGDATNRLAAANEAALYRWSDDSEFVRVPKSLLNKVVLAEEAAIPKVDDPRIGRQRVVLSEDGKPSELLTTALGLDAAQDEALRASLKNFSRDFTELAGQHSFFTNKPPDYIGNQDSKTLVTAPFPEEGAVLKQRLHGELEGILGPERAEAFWRQAQNDFVARFDDFGAGLGRVTVMYWGNLYVPRYEVVSKVESTNNVESYSEGGYSFDQLPPRLQAWWPAAQTPAPNPQEQP
jgi:RNA polymerase sigma factor (sigma-70 family)